MLSTVKINKLPTTKAKKSLKDFALLQNKKIYLIKIKSEKLLIGQGFLFQEFNNPKHSSKFVQKIFSRKRKKNAQLCVMAASITGFKFHRVMRPSISNHSCREFKIKI